MKKLWVASALLFSQIAMANVFEIPATNIKKTVRDGVFKLWTGTAYDDVTVDCASFVHGVYFKERGSKYRKFFYLYEEECNDLLVILDKHLPNQKGVCLVLNYETHDHYVDLSCGED